ncbi:MAG: hypothetical protein LBU42_06705 [Prevotellaceae bacterium]|nr:hypothetical protein [Prevotellaceae bacterium]
MQVERSETQHGGYMALSAPRAEHCPCIAESRCAARKAVGASSAGCAALACGYAYFAPSGLRRLFFGNFTIARGSPKGNRA